MGETVIGPTSTAYPTRVYPVLVQTKPRWSDDWAYEPELTFAGGTANAAGADLDVCTLTRRYGVTKEPHETAFSSKVPQNRTGWWVRIEQHGEQGAQQLWIGQIATETREVHGSESHGPSGVQTWTAYGPQQILRKTDISQAWAQKSPNTYDTTAVLLGWMPPINEDPGTGTPGNATSATFGGISKIFGVDGLWNHKELLEYVLGNFIDTDDGPTWTIGGQDDLLEDLSETIPLGVKVSAAELIRLLIPTKYGLDYKLVSTEAGFEVFVYALNALPYSFGDATLAQNPNTVIVHSNETTDNLRTYIEQSTAQCYQTVRIVGKRIVVCCSLGAAFTQSMQKKWATTDETAYKAGTGTATDSGDWHDEARQADKWDAVFQHFGVGADVPPYTTNYVTPYGELAGLPTSELWGWQTSRRETLDWTPLRANVDYSRDSAIDNNPADHKAELLPPKVYVEHVDPFDPFSGAVAYTPAEKFGIGVQAMRNDWGVALASTPNHLLAKNRFTGANPTAQIPLYDYTRLIATIAFEADQRLRVEYTVPDASSAEIPPLGNGVKVIEEPDAEMWLLAGRTVVGVDETHQLKVSPSTPQILRNDADRLALVMAGAIARYTVPRAKASITIKGILPWTSLLGQILTVIDEGGSLQQIQAPITSVSWQNGPQPVTTIQTGFAE